MEGVGAARGCVARVGAALDVVGAAWDAVGALLGWREGGMVWGLCGAALRLRAAALGGPAGRC